MRRSLGLFLGAALVVSACGLPEESLETEITATTTTTTTTTEAATPPTTEEPGEEPTDDNVQGPLTPEHPSDDLLAQMVELAIADLADRFGLDPGAIEVLEAEPVVWPDGSLGCPQPGMIYTQALVGGYRVALGYQGHSFAYHAGADAVPFYCESPSEAGGGDPTPPPVLRP